MKKMDNRRKIAFVLLGMHRSGTSAMGGVLEALGVDFGSNLIHGDPDINPKGYWEHGDLNVLHDQLLKSIDSSWDDTCQLRYGWEQEKTTLKFREKLIQVVNRDFDNSYCWGFKDPRVCRLMPLWLDIFRILEIKPYFIIMLRHPDEVADSLRRRDGFTWEKSCHLWMLHLLEAEYYTRNRQRAFTSYDALLFDWPQVVTTIANEFEIQWPNDLDHSKTIINNLLDGSLKHYNHHKKAVRTTSQIGSLCSETYDIVNKIIHSDFNDEHRRVLDKISEEFRLMKYMKEGSNLHYEKSSENSSRIRAIAFYLPQFHSIPENDRWWGEGFTEWTNVVKAKPLFPGHYQPQLPADSNFYNLRDSDVRIKQAELAKQNGIYGFCYYYYWFNGKMLLEYPFEEVLNSGKPDFPFCLCWANENWTRRWDGKDQEILIKQEYSHEDDLNFIRHLIPAFSDKRYIRIDGKPLLIIYRAELFPDIKKTVEIWRNEMKKEGICEIYLAKIENFVAGVDPSTIGFDAAIEFSPSGESIGNTVNTMMKKGFYKKYEGTIPDVSPPWIYDYDIVVQNTLMKELSNYKLLRCVFPCWDNTARRGKNATVFINSSPEKFHYYLKEMVGHVYKEFAGDERIIFINSWNEWGEGCYLEPDDKYGNAYLDACKSVLHDSKEQVSSIKNTVSVIVVNYNGKHYLEACFDSLLKMHRNDISLELIMVDNLSQDDSVQFMRERMPSVKIIENDVNNFARALNLGIKESGGDYIAFLNNDAQVEANWLNGLLDVMFRDESIGAVQSKILFAEGGKINSAGVEEIKDFYFRDIGFCEEDSGQYEEVKEIDYFTGGSVLLKKSCIDDVGELDEDFIMFFEDMDFSIRCKKAGWKIFYSPASVVYHRYHGTASSELANFFCSRNRLMCLAMHFPSRFVKSVKTSSFYLNNEHDNLYQSLIQSVKKLIEYNASGISMAVIEDLKDTIVDIFGKEKAYEFFSQVEVLTGLKQIKMGIYDHLLKFSDAEMMKAGELVRKPSFYLSQISGPMYMSATLDRPVLAVFNQVSEVTGLLQKSERDRRARLEQVNELTGMLKESETDRATRLEQVNEVTGLLQKSERDRRARLEQVNELTGMLKESEADRAARFDQIVELTGLLKESEADRAARLEVIHRLEAELVEEKRRADDLEQGWRMLEESFAVRQARLVGLIKARRFERRESK